MILSAEAIENKKKLNQKVDKQLKIGNFISNRHGFQCRLKAIYVHFEHAMFSYALGSRAIFRIL